MPKFNTKASIATMAVLLTASVGTCHAETWKEKADRLNAKIEGIIAEVTAGAKSEKEALAIKIGCMVGIKANVCTPFGGHSRWDRKNAWKTMLLAVNLTGQFPDRYADVVPVMEDATEACTAMVMPAKGVPPLGDLEKARLTRGESMLETVWVGPLELGDTCDAAARYFENLDTKPFTKIGTTGLPVTVIMAMMSKLYPPKPQEPPKAEATEAKQ